MRPTSVSASSLHVASLCMRRYEAEYIKYGRGMSNNAAKTGTTCHAALKSYVQRSTWTRLFQLILDCC